MNSKIAAEEILLIMDECAAAEQEIVRTYFKRRSPERDKNWVLLQSGKELTALMSIKIPEVLRMASLLEKEVRRETLRNELHEAWEEMNHYSGYINALQILLNNEPIPIDKIRRYSVRMPDRQWPDHSRRVSEVSLIRELASNWRRAILNASGEGGAAAFHWAVSQLPPEDDFLHCVVEVARGVCEDEIHHGPEEIARLSEEVPSEGEFELVKQEIVRVEQLTIRERNEQFLGVMLEEEIRDLDHRLSTHSIEPVQLFRQLYNY